MRKLLLLPVLLLPGWCQAQDDQSMFLYTQLEFGIGFPASMEVPAGKGLNLGLYYTGVTRNNWAVSVGADATKFHVADKDRVPFMNIGDLGEVLYLSPAVLGGRRLPFKKGSFLLQAGPNVTVYEQKHLVGWKPSPIQGIAGSQVAVYSEKTIVSPGLTARAEVIIPDNKHVGGSLGTFCTVAPNVPLQGGLFLAIAMIRNRASGE